jgi:hypothetical protein
MLRKIARKAGVGRALLWIRNRSAITSDKSAIRRYPRRLISLMSRRGETFQSKEGFRGKKVVIIGPSSELCPTLVEKVKNADILVVVNKGHRSPVFAVLKQYAKTSVLFHCLDVSEKTGGGQLNSIQLRTKGISAIYYPLHEERYFDNIELFHKANFALLPLRRITAADYTTLKRSIKGFTPNTGFAAIWLIAHSSCKTLYVSGINFMRLPYGANYHAHLADHSDVIKLIEQYGNHNPDLDFESFRMLCTTKPNVQPDDALALLLSQPTEYLFYRNK